MTNAFVDNITSDKLKGHTLTENGMKTRKSSLDSVVDLFFKIGASRNLSEHDRIQNFLLAYNQDKDLTLRLALYARDIRGGAGERTYFREILKHLAIHDYKSAIRLIPKVAEVGRADDLFMFMNTPVEHEALQFYIEQLKSGNGLFFKWAPREKSSNKDYAFKLMKALGMKSKEYRKFLVEGTKVVEQQMCAKEWSEINYSHVPSKASQIYSKAFNRNDSDRYQDYLTKLTKGDDSVKINASAIFPCDVIKGWQYAQTEELMRINAQWDALPNYMNSVNVLPMIDVSGSMMTPAGTTSQITCLEVAMSLGIYIADKASGAFKDTFLTFSTNSQLERISGNTITEKLNQLSRADWGMSTNIENAFNSVLTHAMYHKVPQSDMPKVIIILSDMQFDQAAQAAQAAQGTSAQTMIKNQYKAACYEIPAIVYWNINSSNGVPVKFNKDGTALVSGFSPSILTSILTSIDDMSPINIVMKTLMNPKYDI